MTVLHHHDRILSNRDTALDGRLVARLAASLALLRRWCGAAGGVAALAQGPAVDGAPWAAPALWPRGRGALLALASLALRLILGPKAAKERKRLATANAHSAILDGRLLIGAHWDWTLNYARLTKARYGHNTGTARLPVRPARQKRHAAAPRQTICPRRSTEPALTLPTVRVRSAVAARWLLASR